MMSFADWLVAHWLDLLQSVGIVASLLFSHRSFRADLQARRVSSTFTITAHHREIWSQVYRHPELGRILEVDPHLDQKPVTMAEERFVLTLIHHLSATFEAINADILAAPEGLATDIKSFFSLPIAKEVWRRKKIFQDRTFVDFVENALK